MDFLPTAERGVGGITLDYLSNLVDLEIMLFTLFIIEICFSVMK
jgi:hypothetical protein